MRPSHRDQSALRATCPGSKLARATNRAGGIEGGISNGSEVRVRAAFKPISTVPRALRTVDLATGQAATGLHQRSDVCAVVPDAVIAQAMTALVLADLLLDKTGGDSVTEARRNLEGYLSRIAAKIGRASCRERV